MDLDKQKLLLSYLAGNQDLFIKCNSILDPKYFDLALKPAVGFIKRYFEEYKALPDLSQVKVETKVSVNQIEKLTVQQLKYAENELEQFCRNKAIEHAILASPELLNKGEYGSIEKLIREAITVSLQRNVGTDYFHDPEARLALLANSNSMIPTKLKKLDEALGGGVNRQEMLVVAAPSGVGKSITLSNIAKNFAEQGYNGVYFSLELSEPVVAKRFDSMFSGVSQSDVLTNVSKVVHEVKKAQEHHGRLFIKRMPESSTNANHLRAYLKEFELVTGIVPDFVVVDYLDLMASVEKVSVENQFIKDKYVSEELRSIAHEYNLAMLTASQLNRGAQTIESMDELNQGHIAGGISKINTTDNLVAIIQTPQMKARNEMMFKLLKTRSSGGVGSYFMLKFSPVTLRLTNLESDMDQGQAYKDRISGFKSKSADPKKKGDDDPLADVFQVP